MILFDNKENVIKFIICINVLLLAVLVAKTLLYKEEETIEYNTVLTSLIKTEENNTNIYVEYPRFNENDVINAEITDLVYNYIKEFKNSEEAKSLDISYRTFYIGDFVNITFHIENTLSNIKTKNLLIDLESNNISSISDLYDKTYLENEIRKAVYNKYTTDIYNKVVSEDINNFTYIISEDNIEIYFDSIEWNNYDFIPYISIDLNEKTIYSDSNNKNKYIAFTYDDGPSEYTLDILEILESNNSSATFFVTGKNIKGNEEVIKRIYESNSEVGSHGYNHNNLTKLSVEELNNEIKTTSDLFYSITNSNLSLLRPPYGEYNENVTKLNYNIILWSIDSKDWLVKDSEKIVSNVLNNACDGCIVLMHDIYEETLEATTSLIPKLNDKGYNVVSVSELMKLKKYKYNKNAIISYIK